MAHGSRPTSFSSLENSFVVHRRELERGTYNYHVESFPRIYPLKSFPFRIICLKTSCMNAIAHKHSIVNKQEKSFQFPYSLLVVPSAGRLARNSMNEWISPTRENSGTWGNVLWVGFKTGSNSTWPILTTIGALCPLVCFVDICLCLL